MHRLLDDLFDCLTFVELRLLFEITDGISFLKNDLAVKFFVGSGDDPQKAGLTRSVQSQHTDLRPVEKREIDVLKDRLLVVKL